MQNEKKFAISTVHSVQLSRRQKNKQKQINYSKNKSVSQILKYVVQYIEYIQDRAIQNQKPFPPILSA